MVNSEGEIYLVVPAGCSYNVWSYCRKFCGTALQIS